MKRKKHNKTEVYTDAQLTALLKKSEVVIRYDENKTRRQDIEIYYSFVGKVDLPE